MKIAAVSYNNLTPAKIAKTPYPSSLYSKTGNDVFVKAKDVSFGNNTTIAAKLQTFCPEIYRYIMNSQELSYQGLEKVLQRVSPETKVRPFSEIPNGSNVCNGTGAYFHCNFLFNTDLIPPVVKPDGKAIYVQIPQKEGIPERLNLLGSMVHETTHIFQEESSDRLSKCEFIQHLLNSDLPATVKKDTLFAMPKIFAQADVAMQQPYLRYFGRKDLLPQPVRFLNDDGLDVIYNTVAKTNADEYIAHSLFDSMNEYAKYFPHYDRKTVLDYVSLTAQNEREAYLNSANILKCALNVNSPTDLDYRKLVYDHLIELANGLKIIIGSL